MTQCVIKITYTFTNTMSRGHLMIKIKKKYLESLPTIGNRDWSIHFYWDAFRLENMNKVTESLWECITLYTPDERWKVMVF